MEKEEKDLVESYLPEEIPRAFTIVDLATALSVLHESTRTTQEDPGMRM